LIFPYYERNIKSVIILLTLYQLNTVVSTFTAYMGMLVRRGFALNKTQGTRVLHIRPVVI
jgi:predicted transcriptional regulator